MAKKKQRRQTNRWEETPVTVDTTFEKYYRMQGILADDEYEPMLEAFRQPLPTTFRVTGCSDIAPALNNTIKTTFVPFLTGLEHEGVKLSPPTVIPWYPKEYAWQLDIGKKAIRKNEAFRRFQNFLVYESDSGHLSRQEAVSMVPPLLMQVKPNHKVLDMCAAPGSKTSQLLEALHTYDDEHKETTGLLIANDSEYKRCYLLVHQSLRRIPSPSMMVSNHDASQLPTFRLSNPYFDGTRVKKNWSFLQFDRILCDVPCTGDGTLRKNMAIWNKWQSGIAFGLHPLQLRILLRGIQLLRPGGRLVYSTCSLNPIENEAVISAALAKCPDMRIVDVSAELPGLKRRPGINTWKVIDNKLTEIPHAERETAKMHNGKPFHATLWPEHNPNVENIGLKHCLRIYPHLQNTGGFFVCVLEKAPKVTVDKRDIDALSDVEAGDEKRTKTADEEDEAKISDDKEVVSDNDAKQESDAKEEESDKAIEAIVEQPIEKLDIKEIAGLEDIAGVPTTSHYQPFREAPFIYLPTDNEQVKTICEFFDLTADFPRDQLLVRNSDGLALRSIYMTSELSKKLLTGNNHLRLRMVSCGVKLFTRQDNNRDTVYECKWRVLMDGVQVLRKYMGPKRLTSGDSALLKLLMGKVHVTFDELKNSFPEFHDRMMEMEAGSAVFECTAKAENLEADFEEHLVLPIWRSRTNVGLMVEKVEKSALSLRLFGSDITPHAAAPKKQTEEKTTDEQPVEQEVAEEKLEDK